MLKSKDYLSIFLILFVAINLLNSINYGYASVDSSITDKDKDGISEKYEIEGIDINNDNKIDLSLKEFRVSDSYKDIFVELDYMPGFKPSDLIKNKLINAFSKAPISNPNGNPGIKLHLIIDEQIDGKDKIKLKEIKDIKNSKFGTSMERSDPNKINILAAKSMIFHYGLFVDKLYESPRNSGIGFHPFLKHPDDFYPYGMNFVVSLGAIKDRYGANAITADKQASTLMHELGHNLGLWHGGGYDVKYQPNYFSIMNYIFQSGMVSLSPNNLDYSICRTETGEELDERKLNEKQGLKDCIPQKRMTAFHTASNCDPDPNSMDFRGVLKKIKTSTPTNWNSKQGIQNSLIEHDTNCDRKMQPPLKAINDWESLCLLCANKPANIMASNAFSEAMSDSETENKLNFSDYKNIYEEYSIDDTISLEQMNLEYIEDIINNSSEPELENSDSLLSSDSPSGLAESDFYPSINNKEVLIDMLGLDSSSNEESDALFEADNRINETNIINVNDALARGNYTDAVSDLEKMSEYTTSPTIRDAIQEVEEIFKNQTNP
jgi:hypothetical protein